MFPVVQRMTDLICQEASDTALVSQYSHDNERYIGGRLASIGDKLNKSSSLKRHQAHDEKQTVLMLTQLLYIVHMCFIRFC